MRIIEGIAFTGMLIGCAMADGDASFLALKIVAGCVVVLALCGIKEVRSCE